MIRATWLLAIVLVTALLGGCGGQGGVETGGTQTQEKQMRSQATVRARNSEKHPEASGRLQEVEVSLDGYEGPESVGIVTAEERGYFAEVGLSADVTVAASPARSVRYVVDRTVDLGVTRQPQIVLAKERGAPIVAIGSLISQPTAALIWLKKSRIGSIADLKGKTIAIPGLPFQRDFLKVALARGGLTLGDVKVKSVGYDLVPALVSGRADAIFGGSWNLEGVALEAWGLDPVITRVRDLGIPPYEELVLIARTDRVADNPRMIRDFMSALARGTAAAVDDPASALDSIEGSGETNIELGRNAKEAQLDATLPLLSKSAHMDPGQANELVAWMYEQGMIQSELPTSALLTNAYR